MTSFMRLTQWNSHLGEMPTYPILLSIMCTFFIENDAEILPAHCA